LCLTAGTARAAFVNSLWIGTDNTNSRDVLNTDRSGNVLQAVTLTQSTGFAIDLNANVIYFGDSFGDIIPRNLTTLTPGATFFPTPVTATEDMTFDGNLIWRAGKSGPAASQDITKIDPVTQVSSIAFSVPFQALGITWDGSGFWISEFGINGLVQRFDAAGNPGASFNTSSGFLNGGLAFDNTDNTLYIGALGKVFHYTTTGTQLGSFSVDPSTFVDGLEFEGAVPEPSSLVLLGLAIPALAWRIRRHRGIR
jgi:hypothetical protein